MVRNGNWNNISNSIDTSGSIGTSTSSPLAVNTPTLTASAAGGNVSISDAQSVDIS